MGVRAYRAGDEVIVMQIHNEAFKEYIEHLPPAYGCEKIDALSVVTQAESPDTDLWITETGGSIVGYAFCQLKEEGQVVWFAPSNPEELSQSDFAVRPNLQRRGVGTLQLREILKHYAKSKAQAAIALVFSDNLRAERFLAANDFELHDVFWLSSDTGIKPTANSTAFARVMLDSISPIQPDAKITTRKAKEDDANAVARIHKANVWWCEECSTLEWCKDYIAGKYGHQVIVAEYDGRVVGAADFFTDKGRIGIAGVLPEHQKQGIGTTLLLSLLQLMKEMGFSEGFVDSGLTQQEAIRMYERLGFQIERRQNCWVKILK
ncbi:MAG: GNAT family N-acetyltransferase [Candidatus Thorarchaeota archaeon]|nr:GNAT family N-acetyltransferase [Candidatus Thorarchaeota archaeon]